MDGVNVLRPPSVDDLPGLVSRLRASDGADGFARDVAARGAAWARRELTLRPVRYNRAFLLFL